MLVPVPDRRTLIVLASLIGSMTVASGMLLILEPTPVASNTSQMSLSSVESVSAASGENSLFRYSYDTQEGKWTSIVVHEIAWSDWQSRFRGAAQEAGYHFMIESKNQGTDGRIQVTHRWRNQRQDIGLEYTDSGNANQDVIKIFIPSGGDVRSPSEQQLQALIWLVHRLQSRFGIPADHVTYQIDLPGAVDQPPLYPVAWFRQQLLTFVTP